MFGAISLIAASFFVLRQGNFKRLLAYSSIEHMGIIALGIGFGAPLAVAGALLHVITHASAKGLAFFGTGSLLRGYDTKEVEGVTDAGRRDAVDRPDVPGRRAGALGLPLSGVFRSEFEIVCRRVRGATVRRRGVAAGVRQHRVLRGHLAHRQDGPQPSCRPRAVADGGAGPGRRHARRRSGAGSERSVWMIAGMLGCLFVVVALGVHLPGRALGAA